MDRIYLRTPDGEFKPMNAEEYEAEKVLQELLQKHPGVLAGEQIDPQDPPRFLSVKREVSIPGADGSSVGTIDHLFLDQNGVPTFIEVKRRQDARIRREVVGQMLDYAANAVYYLSADDIRGLFEVRCAGENRDAQADLTSFLQTDDTGAFWLQVKRHLAEGRLRMLFVADRVPPELRRVVEFLNERLENTEVLAIEVPQYVADGGFTTFVPRVVGQTIEASSKKAGPRTRGEWNKERFIQRLTEAAGMDATKVATRLLTWAEERGFDVRWGTGSADGSFSPAIVWDGVRHPLMSVYSYGSLEVPFIWMREPPFSERENRVKLKGRLNSIPGISIADADLDRRPSMALATLQGPAFTQFTDAFDWVAEQIKGPASGS